ncbi:MAG TPA: hypothetical protein VF120_10540 [Ktedonobacterales bacterium]
MATGVSGDPETTHGLSLSHGSLIQRLLAPAIALEAFLLVLVAVAPLGGIAQSISPLARAWPWLLWPARALFGDTLVAASVPPDRAWPQLALFAFLLVGASLAQALAALSARGRDLSRPSMAGQLAPAPPGKDAAAVGRAPAESPRPASAIAFLVQTAREHKLLLLVSGATLLFGVTLLLLPSLPSDDIFSYILYGRISAVHGANPLVATPADFPGDPFLSLVFWRNVRSVYGPVWLLLSGGLSLLAQALGGSLVVYVLLFKLLGLGAHLANALLIWAILGRLAPNHPGRQLFGTLLYAWNPLCLLEFCASAHNDAVMLLFLLLGVYCLVRGWEWAGLVAFGLSISTKYLPLILLPFYVVYIVSLLRASGSPWRPVLAAVAWRFALIFGVVALTAIPYWAGPRTLGALLFSPPAQQLDNSLLESISWPLRALTQGLLHVSAADARSLVDNSLKIGALALFVLLWLRELRRATSLVGMLTAWGWALLWYAVVASGWFWPWYVTWGVAVVALLPVDQAGQWQRLSVATLLLAAGALTLYGFLPLQSSPIYGDRSVVLFGPVLVYLGLTAWRERRALLARERAWWGHVRTTIRHTLASART